MKLLIIISTLFLAIQSIPDDVRWKSFKSGHNKLYTNIEEETYRYQIFIRNLQRIDEHNEKFKNGESTYKMGINKFADLTGEEFVKDINQKKLKPNMNVYDTYFVSNSDDVPDEFDWTEKGAVTPVKDQGMCGSCWSFSVTGSVEGQNFIKTGQLKSLSQQNLLDCTYTCLSCLGGFLDKAMDYIKQNGIMLDKDYRYTGTFQLCSFNSSKVAVKIKSYVLVKQNDEHELKMAVARRGPVSVAIDASEKLQLYESGIFNDDTCGNASSNLNHGVLVTGYSTQNGMDYWKVKNSWGENWGQNGYVWMSRNADNQCGIAVEPIFPEM